MWKDEVKTHVGGVHRETCLVEPLLQVRDWVEVDTIESSSKETEAYGSAQKDGHTENAHFSTYLPGSKIKTAMIDRFTLRTIPL